MSSRPSNGSLPQATRSPVAHGLDARVDDLGRPRHAGERRVEALAHGDDVEPPAGLVVALDVVPGRPVLDDPGHGPRDAEAVLRIRREDIGLPGDLGGHPIERLEHEPTGAPCPSGSAEERHRISLDPESLENGSWRRRGWSIAASLSRT